MLIPNFFYKPLMANRITIFRALLVPVFVTAIVYAQEQNGWNHWIALFVFITACLTDAVDGYIARSRSEQTLLGQILDPIADKLLLISAFLCLFFSPHASIKPPAWVVILVVTRDLFILAGIVVIYMTTGTWRAQPSLLGKVTTASQMITIIALLIPLPVASSFWRVTAILTLASGLSYLWREVHRIKEHAVR